MKLKRTSYFTNLNTTNPFGSIAYHFEYPILKPKDLYEKLFPYRYWNIMAHTLNYMQVAPGLNTRRRQIKVKATLFKQLRERVKQWLSIPVLKVSNLR